jgi:hypothetical protein
VGTPDGSRPDEDVSFARGMGCPLGLFTKEVKTHVDEDVTFKLWLELCHRKNTTSSELLRDVVYLLVHGKTPAELTAEDRRRLLGLEGRIGALSRIGEG